METLCISGLTSDADIHIPMKEITVQELKTRLDQGEQLHIIDVREDWEYDNDHITPTNLPLGTLPEHLESLSHLKDREIILCCRSGGRSGNATRYLESQGFTHAVNLVGGMLAWKQHIDPTFNV